MAQVKIDKLSIHMRGVSRGDARRAIAHLAPALQRALAPTQSIAPARQLDVRVARGSGALADRIAAPLAAALQGRKR